jgi:hypothetical protein
MARYFVSSIGSNTAPYDTWAKAATSLQTALTAANANGDEVVLSSGTIPAGDSALSADTTYTFAANVTLVSSTISGTADIAPSVMGTGVWIGSSTTNRGITLAGAFRVRVVGITFRTAGSTADSLFMANTDGMQVTFEDCYFWHGNSATTSGIMFGNSDVQTCVIALNCVFRFGNAAQSVRVLGKVFIEGGLLSTSGSQPTAGLFTASVVDPAGGYLEVFGFRFGDLAANPVVGDCTTAALKAVLINCSMGAGFVPLATQTTGNRSGAEVTLIDCHNATDDVQGFYGYYNALGSLVRDAGIYLTAGAAAASWKLTTTANAGPSSPFVTPWFSGFNSDIATSITPWIEALRDGSATPYTDAELWGEFMAKNASGQVYATFFTDRLALGGTPASQPAGVGTGSWTGEGGTAVTMKLDSGAAFTPDEAGDISGRVGFAVPSATVYIDISKIYT